MSKVLFTDKQVKELSKNIWIKKVSNKSITYTKDFKVKLVKETEHLEKFPRDVFIECGINSDIVGDRRIQIAAYHWRKQYKDKGELTDERGKLGRPRINELSSEEKLKRAEARIKLLEAENELLKKNEMIEMGLLNNIKSISNLKP